MFSDVWNENAAPFNRMMKFIQIHQYYIVALSKNSFLLKGKQKWKSYLAWRKRSFCNLHKSKFHMYHTIQALLSSLHISISTQIKKKKLFNSMNGCLHRSLCFTHTGLIIMFMCVSKLMKSATLLLHFTSFHRGHKLTFLLTRKLPATAIPWVKLSIKFASRLRYPTTCWENHLEFLCELHEHWTLKCQE